MSDERLSLPSASSRARDSRCPGALNLIRSLIEAGVSLDDGNRPWTESGTRIHAAVAGEEIDLEHEEESARETVAARLARLRKDLAVPDDAVEIIEQRFWLRLGLKKIASGQPDLVWVFGNTAVIPDIKTGWLNAEREDSNPQLRAYAVLIALNAPGIERVIVALAQAHGAKPQPVEYNKATLDAAELEWRAEILECNNPDAPRIAGPVQCKYCAAKLHCDKARAVVGEVAALTIHEQGLTVTNEEIVALLDRCGHAKRMIGEIEAEAKRRLAADPACLPGWKLAEGKTAHPITDLVTVFNRCLTKGITAEQFTAGCSITKKNLTAALKTATSTKGKALDATVKEVLEGCTGEKKAAFSLERIS